MRLLLDKGADIDIKYDKDQTVQQLAENNWQEGRNEDESRLKAIVQLLHAKDLTMPRLVNSLDPESLSISSEFLATFVDFSPGGVTSRSYPKVSELLGDQPPVDQTSNKGFKWLHLPVNNVRHIRF